MDSIEKDQIVHGYDKYVPFKFTDEIIDALNKIQRKQVDANKIDFCMRSLSGEEVLKAGRDYLNSRFILRPVLYLSTDARKKVENNKRINPNILCGLYSKKINPFDIPVEFVYGNYYAGDLLPTYDFSDDIKVLKKMKIYFEKIYLSKQHTVINSSSYVHEIVHTQVEKKGIIKDCNNAEVLSIFMELLFLNDSDSYGILAYFGLLNRISYMLLSYNIMLLDESDSFSYKNMRYFISTIKAIDLYIKYINSNYLIRSELLRNIQNIFDGNLGLEEFLSNFDINVDSGLKKIKEIGGV